MKISGFLSKRRGGKAGFSICEAVIGLGLVGTVASALLTGVSSGVFTLKLARENARASQIMTEKLETIRLYNWSQINSNGFIPPTFTAQYDPNNPANPGLTYNGRVTIENASLGSSYSNEVRAITITVSWLTGGLPRQRQNTTYVSHYGLSDFVY